MKGTLTLFMVLLLRSFFAAAQPGLSDYLQVVAGFTENRQNLEAVKLCNKLVTLYPDNPDIYFLRGVNHYFLKDYVTAIDDFDRALHLNPDYPDVYLYRAKAKKENKDYLGAIRDYSKAKDENFSQTLSSLAGDMIKSFFSGKGEAEN